MRSPAQRDVTRTDACRYDGAQQQISLPSKKGCVRPFVEAEIPALLPSALCSSYHMQQDKRKINATHQPANVTRGLPHISGTTHPSTSPRALPLSPPAERLS